MSMQEKMETTRTFWNANPCGSPTDLAERMQHRYAMEPWVPDLLESIAARHQTILEIGCGQGTDGMRLCSLLPPTATYMGIDYSDESVASANKAKSLQIGLPIQAVFQQGNAEQLSFADETFDSVFSIGVLHHTQNPTKAFAECLRVLKPGGTAYIALYRKFSIKLSVAKLLRAFQWGVDRLCGTDRVFYRLFYGRHAPKFLGTMILECFGVPYMYWYTKSELKKHFAAFDILDITSVGYNLPMINPQGTGKTPFGYMLLATLRKPQANSTE